MNEYLDMWRNYANFSGRTSVRGYWMAVLFNCIASFVVGFVAGLIGLEFLGGLYSLAVLIPGLAICVRRLRDAGLSWTNLFWSFLPIAGAIILIVKLCKPSVGTYNTTAAY